MQGFASDAEYIGGFRLISIIGGERFHDDVPFRFGEGGADLDADGRILLRFAYRLG